MKDMWGRLVARKLEGQEEVVATISNVEVHGPTDRWPAHTWCVKLECKKPTSFALYGEWEQVKIYDRRDVLLLFSKDEYRAFLREYKLPQKPNGRTVSVRADKLANFSGLAVAIE